ncbi:MAG: hypothetical protein NVS1B14_02900 [Vulcanimicrobiaceae bacterium]
MCACAKPTFEDFERHPVSVAQIDAMVNAALSWHVPVYTQTLAGATLLRDGRPFRHANLAVARSIERSNARLSPLDALHLADVALDAARSARLNPEFFCATLIQESAFDPNAVSSAGAVGIAQFTLETADASGVDPFDPLSAIAGAAALLSGYLHDYTGKYADPYAASLAAYNAGPAAVSRYRGVPPYPETQAYVSDVYARWARILSDER